MVGIPTGALSLLTIKAIRVIMAPIKPSNESMNPKSKAILAGTLLVDTNPLIA